jgi:hypothetical protein
MQALSLDLRARIVKSWQQGQSKSAIARVFMVSLSSVKRFIGQFNRKETSTQRCSGECRLLCLGLFMEHGRYTVCLRKFYEKAQTASCLFLCIEKALFRYFGELNIGNYHDRTEEFPTLIMTSPPSSNPIACTNRLSRTVRC